MMWGEQTFAVSYSYTVDVFDTQMWYFCWPQCVLEGLVAFLYRAVLGRRLKVLWKKKL